MGLEKVAFAIQCEAQRAAIGEIAEHLAIELHDVVEGIDPGRQLRREFRIELDHERWPAVASTYSTTTSGML